MSIINLYKDQAEINLKIAKQKKQDHKEYKKLNPTTFMVLDILVIVIILMNFGAIFITNFMVARNANTEGVTLEYVEVNPVAAKAEGFTPAPKASILPIFISLFSRGIFWAIVYSIYWRYRNRITNDDEVQLLIFILGFYLMVLGTDVFNNLGFFIGGL